MKEVKKGTVKDSRSQRGIAGARKDASHSSLETSTTNKKKVLTKINNLEGTRDVGYRETWQSSHARKRRPRQKPNAIDYSIGGTVYPVPQEVKGSKVVYQNADGMRVDDGRYQNFKSDLKNELMIPEERIITDGEDVPGARDGREFLQIVTANGGEDPLGGRSEEDFTVREETPDAGDVSSGWDVFEWASGFGFGSVEVVARREELSRLHGARRREEDYVRTWIDFGRSE